MWEYIKNLIVPHDPVAFWTMALTFATAWLAIVALRGLGGLGLTKSDILTRAQREARHCAIARAEDMAKVLIPANRELSMKLGEALIPVFVRSAEEVSFDRNKVDRIMGRANTWVTSMPPALQMECISYLNRLEAWSMYFTNGLADDEIAFGPCAPTYCSQIAQYFPVLIVHRANQRSGKYPNAVKLFETWWHKLKEEESGIQMKELVAKISELQHRKAAPNPLPKPIGTQLD